MGLSSQIKKTRKGRKIWERERFYFQLSERICELADEHNLSIKELASTLSMDRNLIRALLENPACMPMEIASKIFWVFGRRIEIVDHDIIDDGNTNI